MRRRRTSAPRGGPRGGRRPDGLKKLTGVLAADVGRYSHLCSWTRCAPCARCAPRGDCRPAHRRTSRPDLYDRPATACSPIFPALSTRSNARSGQQAIAEENAQRPEASGCGFGSACISRCDVMATICWRRRHIAARLADAGRAGGIYVSAAVRDQSARSCRGVIDRGDQASRTWRSHCGHSNRRGRRRALQAFARAHPSPGVRLGWRGSAATLIALAAADGGGGPARQARADRLTTGRRPAMPNAAPGGERGGPEYAGARLSIGRAALANLSNDPEQEYFATASPKI